MAIDLLKQVAQDVTVQRRTQISRGSRADSEAAKQQPDLSFLQPC